MPRVTNTSDHTGSEDIKKKPVIQISFPRDEFLRDAWIQASRRSDKINSDHAVIYSVHFCKEDIAEDMKSRLLGIERPKNQRILKKDAVPSLSLPKDTCSAEPSRRSMNYERREMKKTIQRLISVGEEELHNCDRPTTSKGRDNPVIPSEEVQTALDIQTPEMVTKEQFLKVKMDMQRGDTGIEEAIARSKGT
ncbi:uncharacterized protein LOC135215767 [Macrobrachium nipponense]|uniref:uncharacterized protein LOC135215767 n=1 Tax=Macrobrachium nipponense TaxID=159736 RepID=UPI0030C86A06